MKKEIEEDIWKWNNIIPYHWIRKANIVKIAILPSDI